MATKISVFAAEGKGDFLNPKITTSIHIISESMNGIGEFLAPAITQSILIFPPPMEGIGNKTKAIVFSRTANYLQANPAEGYGDFKKPNLSHGGGQYIIAESMEGQGEMNNPVLDIGASIKIQAPPMEGRSLITFHNINYDILNMIKLGSEVALLVNDSKGNAGIYRGIVRKRHPENKMLKIKAIIGDGIFGERIIDEDYTEQDIGLTAKEMIDKYCSPLTTENINTETGITAPIKAEGRKPLQVLESMRREHGIFYHVDFAWDVHFYLPDEIEPSNFSEDKDRGYKIKLGVD